MKRQSIICAALFSLFALAGASGTANADPLGGVFGNSYAASDQDEARDAVRSGDYISMEQALAAVRKQYPGRLLDAEFSRGTGIYQVKMLSAGEIVLVSVDARDGSILNVRRGGR